MDATLKKEDLDSWKAYLRWQLVNANAPYLSSAFVNADFDFFGKTLTGAQELQPRWKRCVNYVDNDLGEALGQAYVQRAFPPEAKQRAQKLVKQIEEAMQQDIDALPWMSPATKQQALEKLHTVANKIGYPDKWRDYSALTIARDDYMGNVLRARVIRVQSPDREDRQACGPGRMGHDAAHRKCLLQSRSSTTSIFRPAFCSRRSSIPARTMPRTTATPAPPSDTN